MAEKKKKQEELLASVTDSAGAQAALAGLQYEKSQQVQQAEQALADYQAQKPGAYTSGWQQQIDTTMKQLLDRKPFAYDLAADPAWQAYKQSYTRRGRLAMQDTMANAAALTGGYGSSYGAAAGSQAYQGWLDQLGEKIPALYQLALDRYDAEGTAMQDTLDALVRLEGEARSAYEADVDDWYKGLDQYAQLAQAAYDRDYDAYRDLVDSLTDMREFYADQEEQTIRRKQNEADHALAVQKFQESVRQWEAEQAAAQAKWQAQLALDQAELEYKKAQQAAKAAQQAAAETKKTPVAKPGKTTKKQQPSTTSLQSLLNAAYERTK